MTIQTTIINEINLDGSEYKYFIYKKLDYISDEELISLDPRNNVDFIDVPKVIEPLGYEYLSDGVTKFTVMILYKIIDSSTSQLSAIFRSEDYYDSELFTKMTINIILTGVVNDKYNIDQINIQLLDHNNQPYTIHNDLVNIPLNTMNPNTIHYNKDLTRLIKSTTFINPNTYLNVLGSNVVINNDLIRRVAYVNTLEEGQSPVIYNNDFIGQIIESSNRLDANTMQIANLLYCPAESTFIDNDVYPELTSLIADTFLYNYELYVKIIDINSNVTELKYSDLTPSQIPLIVEEYYVQTPDTPQVGKTKLPSKNFLGPDNNIYYYIKFATSLNTINKLIIKDVNGVLPNTANSIILNTDNIPPGNNNKYLDQTAFDDLRDDVDELLVISDSLVLSVNTDILPDINGNIVLNSENLNYYDKESLNIKFKDLENVYQFNNSHYKRRLFKNSIDNLTISGNSIKNILNDVIQDTNIFYKQDDYIIESSLIDKTAVGIIGNILNIGDNFLKEITDSIYPVKTLNIYITLSHDTPIETTQLEVSLWRNDVNPTLIRYGNKLVFNGTDTLGDTSQLWTFSIDENDFYSTEGYFIILRNLTSTDLTYSKAEIIFDININKKVL